MKKFLFSIRTPDTIRIYLLALNENNLWIFYITAFILILFKLSPNFYISFYSVLLFTYYDLLFCEKQLKLAVLK